MASSLSDSMDRDMADEIPAAQATMTSSDEDVDTMTMADRMLEDQGYHETEVSYGGEADLLKRKRSCKKNPGHKHFIPLGDFNIEHLPPEYQDKDIVEMIRARAELTVRLTVKKISFFRPEFYDIDKKNPFPYYRYRGNRGFAFTGTGWVESVGIYEEYGEAFHMFCSCDECQSSDTAKKIRGYIQISTAAHVVFDYMEASSTTCHFFYDDGQADLKKVLKLTGFKVSESNYWEDFCKMRCYTHDVNLLQKLDALVDNCRGLEVRLCRKYSSEDNSSCEDKSADQDVLNRLCTCVSHPHGCSKQISIGRVIGRRVDYSDDSADFTQYTYDTPTCNGSSGAHLFILGLTSALLPYGEHHCHSGGEGTDDGNINTSAIRREVNFNLRCPVQRHVRHVESESGDDESLTLEF